VVDPEFGFEPVREVRIYWRDWLLSVTLESFLRIVNHFS